MFLKAAAAVASSSSCHRLPLSVVAICNVDAYGQAPLIWAIGPSAVLGKMFASHAPTLSSEYY